MLTRYKNIIFAFTLLGFSYVGLQLLRPTAGNVNTSDPIADTNGDLVVDIFDLSYLLNNWGTNNAAADFVVDGSVNIFDLSYMLAQWLRDDSVAGCYDQAPPTNCVFVDDFGAVGDGVTDDTVALNQAFSRAPEGSIIALHPAKTYAHNDIVHIVLDNVTINGGGTLLATREDRSAVWIDADNVTVESISLNMQSTTQRWVAYEQMKLRLKNTTGTVLRNISIDGSAAAGIFVGGSNDYTIDSVTVENTRADAIHNTEGSHDGHIINPTVRDPGDDGVAVVSYENDGVLCHSITIDSPRFFGNTHGRAFTVVGGRDIVFNDVYAENSNAAGLYVASEPSFQTYGVQNVTFNGGRLVRSNVNATNIDHGAILVFNGRSSMTIQDVSFNSIVVEDTDLDASWQVGILAQDSGGADRISFDTVDIIGGPPNLLFQNGNPTYNTTNWTHNNLSISDHVGF